MSSISVHTAREAPAWRIARQRRILTATLGLLETRPAEAVSMDAMARAAGVGKATLYRYFETKEALLRACLEELVGELGSRLEDAEATDTPAPERLEAIIAAMVFTFSRHLIPLRLLTRTQGELHEEWRRWVQDARRRLVDVLRRHFEAGHREGWYGEVDAELVPHLVMGMIRSAVAHTRGRSNAQITEAIRDMVLAGCRAP